MAKTVWMLKTTYYFECASKRQPWLSRTYTTLFETEEGAMKFIRESGLKDDDTTDVDLTEEEVH